MRSKLKADNEECGFIFDKYNLASFLCNEYFNKTNAEITPIKLQKGLYFLYAFWGGKILSAQGISKEDTEDDDRYGNYCPYLFDAHFMAWKYGPVEHDIYKWYKYEDKKPYNPTLEVLRDKDYEIEIVRYVREFTGRIFATSDFGLVDLSHEDKCWQRCVELPDSKMNNNEILKEYASRT